jgi:hypothetical protein
MLCDSFSSIEPLGWFWQEPEPSQATGMVLACCILGKFLGVGCHWFPPPLDVPAFPPDASTSATTWEILAAKWGTVGEKWCLVILPKWRLPCHLGIFYMPQIYGVGPMALLPLRRNACWGFFALWFSMNSVSKIWLPNIFNQFCDYQWLSIFGSQILETQFMYFDDINLLRFTLCGEHDEVWCELISPARILFVLIASFC